MAWVAACKPSSFMFLERCFAKLRAALLSWVQRGALLALLLAKAAPPAGKRIKGRA